MMKKTTKGNIKQSRQRIAVVILLVMAWYGFTTPKWILQREKKANVKPTNSEKSSREVETATTFRLFSKTLSINSSGIPKIIHLIWLTARNSSSSSSSSNNNNSQYVYAPTILEGEQNVQTVMFPEDGPLPDYVVYNMKRYQELHPDYQVKVWRNKDVLTTFPELNSLVTMLTVQKKYLSWLSDILRYALLVKFGGIYLDTDFDILRSLKPLRAGFPNGFTFCTVPTEKDKLIQAHDIHSVQDLVLPYQCKHVGCQIAAPAFSPALLNAFTTSVYNSFANMRIVEKGEYPLSLKAITGPEMWTKVVHFFNFTTLIGEVYYPCPIEKRGNCNSWDYVNDPYAPYAMHKWSASWRQNALTDVQMVSTTSFDAT